MIHVPGWAKAASLVVLAGCGLVIAACVGHFPLAETRVAARPGIGETVVVEADPSSEYTAGTFARVTKSYDDFADMRERLRARGEAGIEAMSKRGAVLTLAAGDRVVILNDILQFEEVYEVRVTSGVHQGEVLFISWSNVKPVANY